MLLKMLEEKTLILIGIVITIKRYSRKHRLPFLVVESIVDYSSKEAHKSTMDPSLFSPSPSPLNRSSSSPKFRKKKRTLAQRGDLTSIVPPPGRNVDTPTTIKSQTFYHEGAHKEEKEHVPLLQDVAQKLEQKVHFNRFRLHHLKSF